VTGKDSTVTKVELIKNDYFIESLGLFASAIGAAYKLQLDKEPNVTSYFFPPKNGAVDKVSEYVEDQFDFVELDISGN